MKRLGRRGRVLGLTGCEEDLLDDDTKKQLFAGAGISGDTLDILPIEEQKGILKAILASSPSLLPKPAMEVPRASECLDKQHLPARSSCKKSVAKPQPRNLAGKEQVIHIIHDDSSDSTATHSSDSSPNCGDSGDSMVPQAKKSEVKSCEHVNSTVTQSGQVSQILARRKKETVEKLSRPSSHKKPTRLVLGSDEEEMLGDEEKILQKEEDKEKLLGEEEEEKMLRKEEDEVKVLRQDEEEQETQPYDLLDHPIADTQRSPEDRHQTLQTDHFIPESQADGCDVEVSDDDDDGTLKHDLRTTSSPNIARSSVFSQPRLTACLVSQDDDSDQDKPLTRVYRTQQSQEKTCWPSMFTPSSVRDPAMYTEVIKLMLTVYQRRLCRAQAHMAHMTSPWGKPVTAGCHVKGCLRAMPSRSQSEPEQGWLSQTGRALRHKHSQNIAQSSSCMASLRAPQADDDSDDDFEETFPRGVDRSCRLPDRKRKHLVAAGSWSSLEVTGHLHPSSSRDGRVKHRQHADSREEGEHGQQEHEELVPVKVKRASVRRNEAVLSERNNQTQVRSRENRRRKGNEDETESGNVDRSIAGLRRKVRQVNRLRTGSNDDEVLPVPRCELGAMFTRSGTKGQQMFVWSEEEEEEAALAADPAGSCTLGNDQIHRAGASKQQGSASVPLAASTRVLVDRTVQQQSTDVLDVEAGLRNTMAGVNRDTLVSDSQQGESTLTTTASVLSSSQSSESLLDGQGNLYCTQLTRLSQKPASPRPCSRSLQKTSRPGKQTCRATNKHLVKTIEALSVDSREEAKLLDDDTQVMPGQADSVTSWDPAAVTRNELPENFGNVGGNSGQEDHGGLDGGHEGVSISSSSSSHEVKHSSQRLPSARRLKRNPLMRVQASKRRKLAGSHEDRQPTTDSVHRLTDLAETEEALAWSSVTEAGLEMAEAINAESSPDIGDCPSPQVVGYQELFQKEGISLADSTCPICGQHFPLSKLEAHASSCGEDLVTEAERDMDEEIRCVMCAVQVPKQHIKEHQIRCLQTAAPARRVTRSTRE